MASPMSIRIELTGRELKYISKLLAVFAPTGTISFYRHLHDTLIHFYGRHAAGHYVSIDMPFQADFDPDAYSPLQFSIDVIRRIGSTIKVSDKVVLDIAYEPNPELRVTVFYDEVSIEEVIEASEAYEQPILRASIERPSCQAIVKARELRDIIKHLQVVHKPDKLIFSVSETPSGIKELNILARSFIAKGVARVTTPLECEGTPRQAYPFEIIKELVKATPANVALKLSFDTRKNLVVDILPSNTELKATGVIIRSVE